MRLRQLTIFTFFAAIAVLGAGSPAAAQGQNKAVIIFDSSFSMWAQLQGKNKVVAVREGLSEAFKASAGKLDLGLVAFGHLTRQACSGVRTLAPVGQIDQKRLDAAVAKVGPDKGATPLAKALEQAAILADYETGPASIILIADGLDNCKADPCAMAQKLRSRATHLRIHVIAFDKVREKELAKLACVSEETEGQFFPATSITQFNSALQEAVQLSIGHKDGQNRAPAAAAATPVPAISDSAASSTPPAPAPQVAAVRVPAPVPVQNKPEQEQEQSTPAPAATDVVRQQADRQDVAQPVTLRLSATLTEKSGLLTTGLTWRIFSPKPDEDGNFRVVARQDEAEGVFQLSPGAYIVHVAFGRANATREVTLEKNDHSETLVLNAGGLRLAAVVADGGPNIAGKVVYAIYSSEQDQFAQRKLIMPQVETGKIVRLNAGLYHVVSQFGDANAVVRANVEVKPGQLSDAVINHEAARVTLKLVNQPGGEALANTSWSIMTPTGDVVSESVGAFPTHILAAGKYTVLARHEGKSYNKDFDVRTGLNQEVELVAQ